uniref:Double jelly roll-like domain-containing protein n=1 Tax=Glossina morsitans morsitans TaxID=37546 RepID=A0A1B0GEQ0_GLOMM
MRWNESSEPHSVFFFTFTFTLVKRDHSIKQNRNDILYDFYLFLFTENYLTIDSLATDRSLEELHRTYVHNEGLSATVLWNVKLASENERPRFLLIAFRNAENKFTHCNLTNVKVHLNSDSYPYDDLNLRFSRNQFALLYDMYSRFQQSYYLRDPYPLLKRNEFLTHAPIVVLDVTHQNESVKTGPIDIRIELKASKIKWRKK